MVAPDFHRYRGSSPAARAPRRAPCRTDPAGTGKLSPTANEGSKKTHCPMTAAIRARGRIARAHISQATISAVPFRGRHC
jgi:hypothetical protein